MDSRKRKLPQGGLLGRRVRARVEPEPTLDFEDDASSGAPSEQDVDENESDSDSASASGDDSAGPVRCPAPNKTNKTGTFTDTSAG